MGTFEKNWNEFIEYEVPKGLLRECNQCFLLLKGLKKNLKWFDNDILMGKLVSTLLYETILQQFFGS